MKLCLSPVVYSVCPAEVTWSALETPQTMTVEESWFCYDVKTEHMILGLALSMISFVRFHVA